MQACLGVLISSHPPATGRTLAFCFCVIDAHAMLGPVPPLANRLTALDAQSRFLAALVAKLVYLIALFVAVHVLFSFQTRRKSRRAIETIKSPATDIGQSSSRLM